MKIKICPKKKSEIVRIITEIVFLFLIIISFIFPLMLPFLNFVILTVTLIVLIYYAYDTHRIANQSVEGNLRPTILRAGWIEKWTDIRFRIENGEIYGEPLVFQVFKNIANNINGYIVIDNKKFRLLFGNKITQIANKDKKLFKCFTNWGWLKNDMLIYAVYSKSEFEKTTEKNGIVIFYNDVEGNIYYTKEDENFSQISGKFKK